MMTTNQAILEEQKGPLVKNSSPTQREGPRAAFLQYLIAISHLGALNMAIVWSWSSTALPSLRESADTLGSISKTEEAWIASITFLAGAVGSPVTGQLMQKCGFRKSLIIGCIPLIFGWMLIIWAPTLWAILLGRFITGFIVSGVGASVSLMGELGDVLRRGRLNMGFDLLFCVGVLAIYIVGTFVGWQAQAAACAAASILNLVLLVTVVVESPKFLLAQGHTAQAEKNLKHLRNSNNIGVELDEIKRVVESEADQRQTVYSACDYLKLIPTQIKNLCSREVMKPIFIATFLQFFLQACGVVPIVCYAVDVFKAAGSEGVHENVSTIVLGFFNLVATGVAFAFVDKKGRRPLLIISEMILFIALFVLGMFLMFKDWFGDNPLWNWFPLFCLVIYITGYSFGVGPLPWVMMGEILSPNAKGLSQGVVTFLARVFGFLVMFYFNDMLELIGQHGVYLGFATVCICGAVFVYFFVPETKEITEEEIQRKIQGSWFHHRPQRSSSTNNGNSIPLNTILTTNVEDPPVCG